MTAAVRRFVAGLILALSAAPAAFADNPFDARGLDRHRQTFNQLPFEHIDPLTGNLLLTFTDLVLPGNAGFDLRIQRTYNSKIHRNYDLTNTLNEDSWAGIGWTLHLGRVFNAGGLDSGSPVIEMPDGSRHVAYALNPAPSGCAPCFITKDFWIYNKGARTLQLTNGVVYTFNHTGVAGNQPGETAFYATRIEDPFGNLITATYRASTTDALQQVVQDLGAQTRTVTFGVSGASGNEWLSSMSFSGRTWSYGQANAVAVGYTLLQSATPPTGPGWSYAYHSGTVPYELQRVTTPNGGTIDYTYKDQLFRIGTTYSVESRVVGTRATGGRDVSGGTWTYTYAGGSGQNETTIVGPSTSASPATTTVYTFIGVGQNATTGDAWSVGLPSRVRVTAGSTLETTDLTWDPSTAISDDNQVIGFNTDFFVFVPLQKQRSITRGSATFTTTNTYGTSNFNDYARPHTVVESGQLSRTTTRQFDYDFSYYIKDKVLSESISGGGQTVASSWTHDPDGFMRSETIMNVQTTFVPDARGNVASSTNARGFSTSFDYSWGTVSWIQTPEHVTTRVINNDGTIDSETRRGFTWNYDYDTAGRLRFDDPPAGATTTITYGSTGASISRSRSRWAVTESLDGFGRVSATEDSEGVKTDIDYDAYGRVSYRSLPYESSSTGTAMQYDGLGRLTRQTYDAGGFTRFEYSGHNIDRTDELGRVTTLRFSSFGDPSDRRLTSVTDPRNVTTTYTYYLPGNLREASGSATGLRQWFYNTRNQLTSETHPESGTTEYGRDAVGNMTSRTDAENAQTTFTYDGNNRLRTVNAPGSVYDATIDYDDADNRSRIANGVANVEFVWDGANRLTRRTETVDGVSRVADFDLDADGNVIEIDYPSGATVTIGVDNMGRTESVSRNGTTLASQFSHHPSGQFSTYRTGDGSTHTLTYDGRHRPVGSVSSAGLNVSYARNNAGNVTSVTDPRTGFSQPSIGYDDLDRITSITGFGANTYQYDDKGNRTFKSQPAATTYSYSSTTSRLSSISGGIAEAATFGYDDNGNQEAHGASTFTYTPTNMLETATVAGVAHTYRYDGDDLRIQRITGGRTHRSSYGRANELLSEFDTTGGTVRWTRDYVYASGRLIAAVSCRIQVSPTSLGFPQSAGTQTIFVTTEPNCAWTPTLDASGQSFLSLSSGAERLGSGSVAVTTTLNNTGASRTGTLTLGGTVVPINQQAGTCTFNVNPTSITANSAGESGSLAIGTLAGCPWQATTTQPSWVTFPAGSSGSGPGSLSFTILANPSTAARTAQINVGGFSVAVSQSGAACVPVVSPTTVTVGSAAVTASVSVTAATGCGWNASSPLAWAPIRVGAGPAGPSASGSGPQTVSIDLAQNLSLTPRSGSLTIAGTTVNLTQSAHQCSYVLNTPAAIPREGGSTTLTIGTESICQWNLTDWSPWLTPNLTSGTGGGAIVLTAPLGPPNGRVGSVTVSGQTAPIQQLGLPCFYGGVPENTAWIVNSGITGLNVDVTISAGCPAGVMPTTSAGLTITASQAIAGGQSHTYSVAANPAQQPRQLYMWMGSTLVHTVNQHGSSQPSQGIESPAATAVLQTGTFVVSGFAADLAAPGDTGVDVVEIFANGVHLGQASYGQYHAGAAALIAAGQLAPRFLNVGFSKTLVLPPGQYTIVAWAHSTVSGGYNSATVSPITINSQPSVTITAPANGTILQAGQTLSLAASASDPDAGDGIARVEYHYNGAYLGQATAPPYAFNFPNAPAGSYTLVARAFDNRGGSRDSAPISLAVNAPPSVSITGPASSTMVTTGATVTFTASASDPTGDPVTVTYLVNGGAFSPALTAPYAFNYSTAGVYGTFTVTARAADSRGGITVSAPITLVVNSPPTIAITSPPNGSTGPTGYPFSITTSPADADDGINRVEFTYNGGIPLGTKTAPPYSLTFASGAPPGSYTVTARVFDHRGATAAATVSFTITGGFVHAHPAGPPRDLPGPWSDPMTTLPALPALWLALRRRSSEPSAKGVSPARRRWWHVFTRGAVGLLLVLATALPATSQVTIEYYHLDPMGSVRMVTDADGDVVQRYDYHVFGEEPTTTGQPRTYAGKVRDPETGYDYFGGRYYAARLGRFTTVDPAYRLEETLEDPQRWNRYSYVKNNPFRYTDPDGRILFDFQEFKANVTEALHFGQDGYGVLVPTVAAIAAIGSIAGDAVTLVTGGVGGIVRAATREVGKRAVRTGADRVLPKAGEAGGRGSGKRFSEATKEAARAESANCVFCGTKTGSAPGPTQSQIDHAIPKSRGGNNTIANAQNTCASCNQSKGAQTTAEFTRRQQ